MKHYYSNEKSSLEQLVSQYEAMSQKGTVAKLEETVFFKVGQYYGSNGQVTKALKAIEDGVRLYPISGSLFSLKAQTLLNNALLEEAQACLNKALAKGITFYKLDRLRIQVLISLNQYEEALALVQQLLQQDALKGTEEADLYYLEAIIYEHQQMVDHMFDSLVDCLYINAFHTQALRLFNLSVDITRRFKEAIKLYDHILHENPYNGEAWNHLANLYCRRGDFPNALECFEMAYHADPAWKIAYSDYADLQFELKEYQKALNVYQELKDQFDDLENCEIEQKIGLCYLKLKNFTEARRHFFRALSIEQSDETYFHLGTSYAEERNWIQAVYFFEEAIVHGDDQCDHYYSALASTYYALGRFDKAQHCFSKAATISPIECTYWIQYASFLIQTGQIDLALEEIDIAFDETVGTELLYVKAVALYSIGHHFAALRLLEEALQEDFDLHKMIFDIRPTLEDDKDIKAIIRYFRGEWEAILNQSAQGF